MHRLLLCIVCLLAFAPRLVPALELGPIDARSALYEPLDARIPIRSARSGDLEGLNVVLGSPAQFELAGVPRLQHLKLLEFIVVEQPDGGGYIHVRTEEPVIEPSLTFLIDVDWPRGRTVRGYRLHLSATASRAAATSPEPRAEPEAGTEPETDATRTMPSPGATRYGPVRSSETLWSIASGVRPDRSVSVQRMMLAIVETNPNAFVIGNVNGLQAGVMLSIPGREEIGPDNLAAAVAEVEAHHSRWSEHRNRTPAPAVPSPPIAAPPPDTETEPGGRVEVVSPETAAGVTGQEDGPQTEALRKELALATEEADASRRENDELKLRLSEAEEHVRELNRLVELKNEEIAALQADLRALAEAGPQPVPAPAEPEPQPVEEAPRPVAEQLAAESTPSPAPAVEDPMPATEPDDAEPAAAPTPTEAEPVAEAEPKTLPFGLGALPVNPVFLVGGAGLLLLLLGVLALLRRRRSSAVEDDVLEAGEPLSSDEDELLFELEAVAAELADEPEEPDKQDKPARRVARDKSGAVAAAAPAAALGGDAMLASRTSDVAGSESDGLVEARIAELWRDEGDEVPARMVATDTDSHDESSETTFDIDALAGDESELSLRDDDADEDFDISDLADDREAIPWETDPNESADEATDRFNRFFSSDDADPDATGVPGSDPITGAGDPFEPDPGAPDDGRYDAQFAASHDDLEPVDAGSGTAGRTHDEVDWGGDPAAESSVEFAPEAVGDADDPSSISSALLDDSSQGGDTEAFSLDEFGEGEVQTRLDLAQVYMEMGDGESARGLLESVLAEGDADQQETAREMLSKLA